MQKPNLFSERDLRALRRVLGFIATSEPGVQSDAYRLAKRIDDYFTTKK
jgi:hypothetical protein